MHLKASSIAGAAPSSPGPGAVPAAPPVPAASGSLTPVEGIADDAFLAAAPAEEPASVASPERTNAEQLAHAGAAELGRQPSLRSYYAPAAGRKGVDLLRALHDVVSTAHTERTYTNARHMLFAVIADPHDANRVEDVYTGQVLEGVSGVNSAVRKNLTAEHAWPQSRGATLAAKTDMHHLFPADGVVNAHRSNLPFGDVEHAQWASPPVDGVEEVSLIGTNADGVKVFEPRPSMQGDIARSMLYFFTRYHGDQPDRYDNDDFATSLPSLLRWHKADPPDDAERARNDAIHRLQGNRNPYIDHPTYVNRVGFTNAMLNRPLHPDGDT